MKRRAWTSVGFYRFEDVIRDLEHVLKGTSEKSERYAIEDQLTPLQSQLKTMDFLPAQRQKAMVLPGNGVTIKYVDDKSDQPCGSEQAVLLGGPGENWEEQGIVRVVACDSPLGKALLRAQKGRTRKVRTKDGVSFGVKIVTITTPDLGELRARCECAVEERKQAA